MSSRIGLTLSGVFRSPGKLLGSTSAISLFSKTMVCQYSTRNPSYGTKPFSPSIFSKGISYIRSFSTVKTGFSFLLEQAKKPYLDFQKSSNIQKITLLTLQRLTIELNPQTRTLINSLDVSTLEETWNTLQARLEHTDEPLPNFTSADINNVSKEQRNVTNIHDRRLEELFLHRGPKGELPKIEQSSLTVEYQFWLNAAPTVPFTRRNEGISAKKILSDRKYIIEQLPEATTKLSPLQPKNPQDEEVMAELLANSEEDAFAIYLLLLPYLNPDVLIHEIGTWNGQNLLNIIMYAHLKGRSVAGGVGTDINPITLNFARTLARGLGLDDQFLKFGWAQGLLPLNTATLSMPHSECAKIAIRFIPILDKNSIDAYLAQAKTTLGENDILGLTYAMTKGNLYVSNLDKAEGQKEGYTLKKFDGGITIFKPLVPEYNKSTGQIEYRSTVLNTYFSEEGFRALIAQYNLEVIHHLIVGENSETNRGVCLLKKKTNREGDS